MISPPAPSTGELVSVVVPMFNVGRYIDATILSVLSQTYARFELLLVDDGSTDHTVERCLAYEGDPRVVLLRQANRGCAAARNLGIRHARGSLLAMLDGDDVWAPLKLERQVAQLADETELGVVHCAALLIDDAGASLSLAHAPVERAPDLITLFRNNPICTPSAAVIRRPALDAVAFTNPRGEACYFDESLECADDLELWLRIVATTGWRIGYLGEVLAGYRVRTDSNTGEIDVYPRRWQHVLDQVRRYAPELVDRHGHAATARIYRYLAQRKFLACGDPFAAAQLARRAVATDPAMLREEPFRSLLTLAASHLACAVPASRRDWLLRHGHRWLGGLQTRGLLPRSPMQFGTPPGTLARPIG